ncbi:MAG: aspartate aminotransferase family protein [Gemmatimonadota bacterium]|nr:aspartate aminotransferase family protein [Gemmatimonadota bacterium]
MPDQPPRLRTVPPGPRSRALARRLAAVESRNVTFRSDRFPIFWMRARGSNVWDADGNRYVDLAGGFAVVAAGHRNPRIATALRRQTARLLHGMGDVHPPEVKVRLLERLARLAPFPEARAVLACSGGEAVDAALKTARLRTGKPGVLAFTGAYHGLTYGALAVTDRALFREPFEDQLNPHVLRAPYPHPFRPPPELAGADDLAAAALAAAARCLDSAAGRSVGAVIVEPVQGRGGDVVPPPGFLAGLAALCRERGLLLVLDEIYTGLGRTGRRFACEHEGVVPDLLCVGKALSGSLPIAACLGPAEVMDAWPPSAGEAKHTSTFLGNPLACAAALASLAEIERRGLAGRAEEEGRRWRERLRGVAERRPEIGDVRGRGLMIGIDLVRGQERREPDAALAGLVLEEALRRGWILLASGPDGNVLSLSPPLTIARSLLDRAAAALEESIAAAARRLRPHGTGVHSAGSVRPARGVADSEEAGP